MASNLDAADLATLTGMVVNVHDGDTLRVVDASGTQHRVRLQGIDSPATKQAFGTKARNRLADLPPSLTFPRVAPCSEVSGKSGLSVCALRTVRATGRFR